MNARRHVIACGAAVLAAILLAPGAAGASGRIHQLHVAATVAGGYVGPLQFDVSRRGIVVADGFTGLLWQAGNDTPLASGPEGGDVGGVAVNHRTGEIGYTTSNADHSQADFIVLRRGREVLRADLAGYEATVNPDGDVHYGVVSGSDCAREALRDVTEGAPDEYDGIVDSHPYAVASLPDGSWAVADAGGNDVLRVSRSGRISTLAVLPSVPWTISADWVAENGLPDCVAGTRLLVEGVPTDVETDGRGGLVITSLPGFDAPDSGRVYRLSLRHRGGDLALLGTGFDLATNVAVTRSGRIYVAELAAGRISQLSRGGPVPVLSLPGVVGVEADGNTLYASVAPALTGGQDPGYVVRLAR